VAGITGKGREGNLGSKKLFVLDRVEDMRKKKPRRRGKKRGGKNIGKQTLTSEIWAWQVKDRYRWEKKDKARNRVAYIDARTSGSHGLQSTLKREGGRLREVRNQPAQEIIEATESKGLNSS